MDRRHQRAPAFDSVEAQRAAFAHSDVVPEPPAGCFLETPEEEQAWSALMKARSASSWSYPDRHVAYTVLRQMFVIRECERRLHQRIAQGMAPCEPDTRTEAYQKNLKAMRGELILNLRLLGLSRAPMKNQIAQNHGEIERGAAASREDVGPLSLMAVT